MPDVHGDRATYDQHVNWTARKATALRRRTLDCGHPNPGEVFYHAWCDRLTCSEACAEAEHDCGDYAGVRSSIEEEPEPVEAAPQHTVVAFPLSSASLFEPGGRVSITLPASPPVMYVVSSVDTIGAAEMEPEGGAPADPVADAMRSEVLRQGLTECVIDGQSWRYWDRRWMPAAEVTVMTPEQAAAFDAAQYLSLECGALTVRTSCPGCDGEAIDHGPCVHGCHIEPVSPHVDAALEPDPTPYRTYLDRLAVEREARGPGINEPPFSCSFNDPPAPILGESLKPRDVPWWRRIWSRTPPTLLPPSPTEGSTGGSRL